jgi:hypothetical protein
MTIAGGIPEQIYSGDPFNEPALRRRNSTWQTRKALPEMAAAFRGSIGGRILRASIRFRSVRRAMSQGRRRRLAALQGIFETRQGALGRRPDRHRGRRLGDEYDRGVLHAGRRRDAAVWRQCRGSALSQAQPTPLSGVDIIGKVPPPCQSDREQHDEPDQGMGRGLRLGGQWKSVQWLATQAGC